jgi:hypothetical protein
MKAVKQTSKDSHWTDEKGDKVPYTYVPVIERKKEVKAHSILKEGLKISDALADFKARVEKICSDLYRQEMIALKADPNKPPKGNYTWYSFNNDIRLKVSINEPVKYSDAAIEAAKQHFDKYMDDNVTTKEEFMKDSIKNAFETKNGNIDPRRVADLLKYKSKTKSPDYINACECLEQGSTRPSSKTYFQISVKNEKGDYENVELNFSKI